MDNLVSEVQEKKLKKWYWAIKNYYWTYAF